METGTLPWPLLHVRFPDVGVSNTQCNTRHSRSLIVLDHRDRCPITSHIRSSKRNSRVGADTHSLTLASLPYSPRPLLHTSLAPQTSSPPQVFFRDPTKTPCRKKGHGLTSSIPPIQFIQVVSSISRPMAVPYTILPLLLLLLLILFCILSVSWRLIRPV